jgi:hypothetical protein
MAEHHCGVWYARRNIPEGWHELHICRDVLEAKFRTTFVFMAMDVHNTRLGGICALECLPDSIPSDESSVLIRSQILIVANWRVRLTQECAKTFRARKRAVHKADAFERDLRGCESRRRSSQSLKVGSQDLQQGLICLHALP